MGHGENVTRRTLNLPRYYNRRGKLYCQCGLGEFGTVTGGQIWHDFHGDGRVADLGDFARELARNAKALARSINGMYPCRLSEPHLTHIPLLWHERIGMGGRGEGKHSRMPCPAHRLSILYALMSCETKI